MDMTIGEYLEKLRISCGYSLRLAAKKTSLSHGYIRDVELGGRGSYGASLIPKPSTLKNFANGYNASFDELMRLAGHIEGEPEQEFEFIEIDFNTIFFIEIDINNRVIYHIEDDFYAENKTLFDFILFENLIEAHGFLRIVNGLYVNLSLIKSYDCLSGRLYFNEDLEGKFVPITHKKAIKYNKIINYYLRKNNSSLETSAAQEKSYIRTIRNIISLNSPN
ncbi:helix-turn-helix domain-containing protein (plasmid) [Paenibacillus sonchi]|uniref:Helix-turn-helix domain-containing protein n=1 Tax=Paenibacillus sonchi TaxID=373687 RepID=A0A974PIT5_9BACL|nr:helix-turn-helix transcriptional regulator [Paenibacillus sonchi]QQZ64636.1 helix-turn-helix domain-containing protein [Paenibacillus sonchi]